MGVFDFRIIVYNINNNIQEAKIMQILFGNPGSGKTKALLEMSAKNNVPILVESEARVQRLLVKAQGYGVRIPAPITINQLNDGIKAVYIDDVKRLVEGVLHVDLKAISINRDDECEVIDLDAR